MNVSLVFVPTPTNDASAESPSVDNQGGVFPPLQLMYIASILEGEGHTVQILDANADSLTKEAAFIKIKNFKTDLVGFSSGVVQWREVLAWSEYFKSKSPISIVVGGQITQHYAKELLTHNCIDYAVYGFRNETINELLDSIKLGKSFEEIEGLCFTKDGEFHQVKFKDTKHENKDLNRLPRPARHLVPNHKYFEFYTKKKNFTLMLTTTGCPYKCSFCSQGFQKWTERPVDDVIDEIEEIHHKFNIREIDFKDNTFTLKKERVRQFCQALKKRGLYKKIRWSCMTRVDCVDNDILELMSKSGCIHIKYGIESGNQKMLDYFSKGTTLDKIKLAVYLTKKHNMEAYGFFQFGGPGETLKSARETSRFAVNLSKGIYTRGCVSKEDSEQEKQAELTLCPDCYLLGYSDNEDYDMWAHWVLDPNYKLPQRTIGTKLTDDQILNIINSTYQSFYFSPSFLWKKLTNPSLVVFKKGSLAALSILTRGRSYKLFCLIKLSLNKLKFIFNNN